MTKEINRRRFLKASIAGGAVVCVSRIGPQVVLDTSSRFFRCTASGSGAGRDADHDSAYEMNSLADRSVSRKR